MGATITVLLALVACQAGPSLDPSPDATPLVAAPPTLSGEFASSPGDAFKPTAEPSTPATAALSMPLPRIAIVPIVGFWSTDRSLSIDQLRDALAGSDRRFRRVVVAGPDLAAISAILGVQASTSVRQVAPKAVLAAVRGRTDVLGLIRAGDIRVGVRALGVDGQTLFGNARVRSIKAWPFTIPGTRQLDGSPAVLDLDPAGMWTLVAAGDVMNDREVYRRTVLLGAGEDFPWSGGTAKIVGRTCCRAGLPFVTARRTGGPGAVATLFRDADLALVNHEGPALEGFSYHPTGLTFTFDPSLEAGLADAGVDVVSLANNHIRNAGSIGVLQTIRAVKTAGLTPVGAGRNVAAARAPAWFTVGSVHVAILAYDAINMPGAAASRTRAGAAPLQLQLCRADIKAARAAGADVVVVVPHWGTEYTSRVTALQRRQAAALVAAGADVVLGSHSHWAGALEAIGRGVVVYSMGDFIFDLPRSEETDEGLIIELTFSGRELVQIDVHPTIVIDRSQPNLLDPTKDGAIVLRRVRDASRTFLDW